MEDIKNLDLLISRIDHKHTCTTCKYKRLETYKKPCKICYSFIYWKKE